MFLKLQNLVHILSIFMLQLLWTMLVKVSKQQQLQLWQENHYKRVTLWLKRILLLKSGYIFLLFLISKDSSKDLKSFVFFS